MKLTLLNGIIIIISFVVVDLLVSTVFSLEADKRIITDSDKLLYGTSAAKARQQHAPHKYSFFACQLDFIILSLIRTAVLLGSLFGVIYNRKDGPKNIVSGSTYSLCLFLCTLVYSPLKLLALSEITQNFQLPWFWMLFVVNIVFSLLGAYVWNYVLTCIEPPAKDKRLTKSRHPAKADNRHVTRIPRPESEEISTLVHNGAVESGSIFNVDPNAVSGDKTSLGNNSTSGDKKTDNGGDDVDNVGFTKSTSLMFRLLRYCRREWIWYSLGFVFLILSSSARIFVPYFTGRVISDIIVSRSYQSLVNSVLIMISLSFANSLFAGLRAGCFMYAVTKVNTRIRSELFLSLVKQEMGFFDDTKTGEITSRLTSDCQTMSDTVANNVNIFLRSLIMFVGSLVVMCQLSWQMTLMVFIAIPIIGVISKVYGKYYEKLAGENQDTLAKSNEVAEEVIGSMRTVRSFANEMGESRRYDERLMAVLKVGMKKSLAFTGYTWLNELFDLLILVGVLWYGGHLVLTGKVKSEDLIVYLLYQLQLGETLFNMGSVYTGLMQAVGASKKVFQLIDRKPTILNNGTTKPSELKGKIEFKNVTFSYPSRPGFPVLEDVSFTVKPGEIVALVGPSGGGKSSCISLLEHFYEPLSGDIYMDGIPIRRFDHSYFHRVIALVGQEPILYARSINENIAYGLQENEFQDEDIVEAAQLANAHNFIQALPKQYETDVGEKGVQLSGGQKQRVAIARALIRAPKVLLLDEATSALDAESEFLVQQTLHQNMTGHTVLLIAHRLSTVEKANRIIVIDGGKVVQEGSHQELLKQDGLYKSLVQRQLLGKGENHRTSSATQMTPRSPVSFESSNVSFEA